MRKSLVPVAALALALASVPAAAAPELDEVIVVLHATDRPVAERAEGIAAAHGGEIGIVYTSALQGFTLTLPSQAVAALTANPNVAYVEPVFEVKAFSTQTVPTGIQRMEADYNPPTAPMDAAQVAVLDTGAYLATNPDGSARGHLDLNLRWVSDCTGAILYPLVGGCSGSGDFVDRHGHATHVSGIIGAKDNDFGSVGAAPGVILWSFKVLNDNGTGTTAMVLAGMDAVTSKADQIDVANMSLGFTGYSQAIDDAITNGTNAGVVWVVAAGNESQDASNVSPASSVDAVTVSAIADFDGLPGGLAAPTCRPDVDDTLADFSNFGTAVQIAAPGTCIYSTDLNDSYSLKSGTSMASPYVAGAFARYIAETGAATNNRADVDAIKTAVLGDAIPQASACGFQDVDSSPEPLLFVNGPAFGGDGTCESGGTPPPNTAPTAAFSSSCTDLTCTFTNLSSDPDVGDSLTYLWDFGDGSPTSSDESPSHTYSADGTYNVTLTATDSALASDSTTGSVAVAAPSGPPPNTAPTASFTNVCTDLDCSFTNTSSDPDEGDTLTYLWDFGDGSPTSSATSPSHSYAVAGTYLVTLIATDLALASDTTSQSVTVTEPTVSTTLTVAVYPIVVSGRDGEVRLGVFDSDGFFVGGATIEGQWTFLHGGREKTDTQTTTSLDTAIDPGFPLENAVFARKFPPNTTILGFCVLSASAPGYTYEATVNCTDIVIIASTKPSRGTAIQ